MRELSYKELQEQGVFDVPYRAFEYMQSQQAKIDELQSRIDEALKILKDWDDQSYRDDMDQLTGEIEDILKGNKDVNDLTEDYETGVTEATFAPCGKGCCEPRFESKGLEYIDHTNVTHWMYMPKPPKDD